MPPQNLLNVRLSLEECLHWPQSLTRIILAVDQALSVIYDGNYTPEDYNQRRADLAQSARSVGTTIANEMGGYGKILAASLVYWNLIVAARKKDLIAEDPQSTDWSRILGLGFNLVSGTMNAIEGYHRIRAASLSLGTEGSVIQGRGWKMTGKLLGAAGGACYRYGMA